MKTKDRKQNSQSDNIVQLPDAKARARARTEEPGQTEKSERVASEVPKPQKGGKAIKTICQTSLQVLNVVQPLLTMLATKKKQLTPAKDVVDAVQGALRKHVGPEQGEQILSTLTTKELEQLLERIVARIGALIREQRAKTKES